MSTDEGKYLDRASLLARIEELEKENAALLAAATSPVPGLAESGPYTLADVEAIERHRRKPYARLRETVKALDEARADATRLREVAADCEEWLRAAEGTEVNEYGAATTQREELCDALSATDSAEWLAKHDAEVRAPLETRIAELDDEVLSLRRDDVQSHNDALAQKVASLESQLAAATNDAARAELRARDVARELAKVLELSDSRSSDLLDDESWVAARELLAAAPDSDARLREVMLKVAVMAHDEGAENMREQNNEPSLAIAVRVVDEVLEVKS